MEVIYMGMRVTPESVADRAQEEGVDVIGISLLSGAHKKLMLSMVKAVEEREIRSETLILVGGTIPEDDEAELAAMGIDGVFPVGSSLADIENFIREHRKPRA
jgi:methylmalonyl-CoA mutase C-terminal domain/subunit